MNTIRIGNDDVPIRCTLEILEDIQNEFGSLTEFSDRLFNKEIKTPDIHAITFALPRFVNEGIETHNESHKIKMEKMNNSFILRHCELSIVEISLALYQEFWRSINAPKQQPPAETNQQQKTQTES